MSVIDRYGKFVAIETHYYGSAIYLHDDVVWIVCGEGVDPLHEEAFVTFNKDFAWSLWEEIKESLDYAVHG